MKSRREQVSNNQLVLCAEDQQSPFSPSLSEFLCQQKAGVNLNPTLANVIADIEYFDVLLP